MTNLLNSKKGLAPQNIIEPLVYLFIFGFLTILGTLISLQIIAGYESSPFFTPAMVPVAESFKASFNLYDVTIFMVAIIFIVGIAVTTYKLSSRPVFFVFTFISAMFYGFLGYFFSYLFSQIISQSIFVVVLLRFPISIILLTNLHWIALVMIVVGAISLYGKREEGQYLT